MSLFSLMAASMLVLGGAPAAGDDSHNRRPWEAGQPRAAEAEAKARPEARAGRDRRRPVPDMTADPWRQIPFEPDAVWDWIRRNNP